MNTDQLKLNKFTLVLAGNPNVGKSVFFTKFTGTYAEVSNYPGTTVDMTKAMVNDIEVIDTPGVYGLGNYNDEEIVAKNIIVTADKIVNVVSALNLERDLFLTQQLIDLGIPLVVALNQSDEALARGLKIDADLLGKYLGVKVISTVAIKNEGIEAIKEYLLNNALVASDKISETVSTFLQNKEFTKDERISAILDYEEDMDNREVIYAERRLVINEIFAKVVTETNSGINLSTFLGRQLLNPFVGLFTGVITLYVLYKIIGVFVAGDIVDYLQNAVIAKYYTPWITDIADKFVASTILKEYLVGEFGVLTMTVTYIFGVLLPLIVGFHMFMSFLEDCGYLPRIAVLTDRFLSKIGLNGKAVIPLILGLGCTTMATISTRILGSKRERTIATVLLGLTIPCSAQLSIIIGIIASIGGLKMWIIYLVTIFTVFLLAGTILNKVLHGESTPLLIDLPPMRTPQLKNIMTKTYTKTMHFIKEATPLFVLGAVVVTTLKVTNGIYLIQKILEPLTVNLLGLPKEAALMFIMGILRRDFAAAGLSKMTGMDGSTPILSPEQALISLVVLTLFVPCVITMTVMYKERGFKEASLIWLGSWVVAFATGGILSQLLRFLF